MNRQTVRASDVIDGSPLSALQVRALLLCFLVLVLDGFDTAAIGYRLAAPILLMGWRRRGFAPSLPVGD
ncbi:hypothetical protein [Pseudomonas panipatensis]|uniref:MFS transporter, AAHS family, 4-hydroxybenzoate transporter n=1 Tax=Pseudomonas panipatensis TaxID=428992 RepID=A0A1G8FG89_9PSED|nr:hypothetical protein [Pseudomonas panipatensis]SDH81164.1 MFS transporter, AAHS family, 4-hydroxybenzoate transporter [Pseudomonas panipatensis]SMP53815.1 hypothetical protein SAMN06295951_103233 [Pseudomonas panipatensis]